MCFTPPPPECTVHNYRDNQTRAGRAHSLFEMSAQRHACPRHGARCSPDAPDTASTAAARLLAAVRANSVGTFWFVGDSVTQANAMVLGCALLRESGVLSLAGPREALWARPPWAWRDPNSRHARNGRSTACASFQLGNGNGPSLRLCYVTAGPVLDFAHGVAGALVRLASYNLSSRSDIAIVNEGAAYLVTRRSIFNATTSTIGYETEGARDGAHLRAARKVADLVSGIRSPKEGNSAWPDKWQQSWPSDLPLVGNPMCTAGVRVDAWAAVSPPCTSGGCRRWRAARWPSTHACHNASRTVPPSFALVSAHLPRVIWRETTATHFPNHV